MPSLRSRVRRPARRPPRPIAAMQGQRLIIPRQPLVDRISGQMRKIRPACDLWGGGQHSFPRPPPQVVPVRSTSCTGERLCMQRNFGVPERPQETCRPSNTLGCGSERPPRRAGDDSDVPRHAADSTRGALALRWRGATNRSPWCADVWSYPESSLEGDLM